MSNPRRRGQKNCRRRRYSLRVLRLPYVAAFNVTIQDADSRNYQKAISGKAKREIAVLTKIRGATENPFCVRADALRNAAATPLLRSGPGHQPEPSRPTRKEYTEIFYLIPQNLPIFLPNFLPRNLPKKRVNLETYLET